MTISFVNIHGQRVYTDKRVPRPKRASSGPGEYHKGWAVEGVPPGALEEAQRLHEQERAVAIRENATRIPDEWNAATWLQTKAKYKRVRTKAYEVPEAATQCKEMAEKAGWLQVSVRALSKGAA
jgi:hypothetical protein